MAFSAPLKRQLNTALCGNEYTAELEAQVGAEISDVAYNASSWDNVTAIGASKNALRDKFVLVDAANATKLTATQCVNVAALAGTLTGTVTGTILNVAAAACAGGSSPTAAQVDTAVAALALSTNLALKEIQTILNAELAAMKSCSQQASS